MKKATLADRLAYAVAWIRGCTDARPRVGVVLGSGLGGFADRLERAVRIPFGDIPEFPVARVDGHAGQLLIGELPGPAGPVPIAAMAGRVHVYEGWSADEVAFPVRSLARLGVQLLLLTNAAGGVNPELGPGDLVLVEDHLNLTGHNPLVGPNDDSIGPRFPDLSRCWDERMGAVLAEEASRLGIRLRRGVYAGLTGPSFETPAEVRMLRALGADLVGMSTVHEAIAARHMGVAVAGISLVANRAAGLSRAPLLHADVQRVAAEQGERLSALIAASLVRFAGL